MPFLIPIAAGIAGTVLSGKQAGKQNKALDIQNQIAQQEMADKQKIFDLLRPFFEQYLGKGSPFLSQIQRAGAEQNAQQFSNAAGQVRSTMGASGLGFGPSGAAAAAIGGLGAEAAKSASGTFLDNLLKNEQLKFEAASGLNSLGGMAGGSQNQPNVGVNLQPQSTGSSVFGLGQALSDLLKKIPGISGPGIWSPSNPGGTLPTGGYPGGPPSSPPLPVPLPGGAPTTSGWGIGP